MSDVDKELDNVEEDLELQNQEQEELQDDAGHQDDGQEDAPEAEEVEEEVDSAEEDEEPKPPSRREQLRIQNLLQKMKEEEGSSPKKTPTASVLDYEQELDADQDTVRKLKTDRETYGQDQYKKGVEEAYQFSRFETRLEVDAPRVETKYPQLDKSSDEFNPVLADTINRMYLSFVGFDAKNRSVRTADVRYADYVESVYELADEIAGNKVESISTNLRKQASKTGVRPGGVAPKRMNLNKAPQDMTDEELEAAIKSSLPRR